MLVWLGGATATENKPTHKPQHRAHRPAEEYTGHRRLDGAIVHVGGEPENQEIANYRRNQKACDRKQ